MNDLRKAAEMALETLETTWGNGSEGTLKQWEETIQALRQALAEPEQKYDYRIKYDRPCYKCLSNFCPGNCKEPEHLTQSVDAVNMSQESVDETAKSEHKWVGLTDEEVDEIYMHEGQGDVVLLTQAKLREKNT